MLPHDITFVCVSMLFPFNHFCFNDPYFNDYYVSMAGTFNAHMYLHTTIFGHERGKLISLYNIVCMPGMHNRVG
jgi:hypothetical protein